MEAVYFGEADEFVNIREKDSSSIAVTYYPEINRYQGRETLQIIIRITDKSRSVHTLGNMQSKACRNPANTCRVEH